MLCFIQNKKIGMLLLISLLLPSLVWSNPLQPMQDAHGVTYVTGGIGAEEVEALEPYKKQFGLYLMFTEGKVGRVIDDVDVRILNQKQEIVFSVDHAAPRLLLNLAAGKYTLIATNQGEKLRAPFRYQGQKMQRVILNWKRAVDEDQADNLPEEALAPTSASNQASP